MTNNAMVTVVLPTGGRAGMLRNALKSLAWQSARERIGCVIVSENAGDKASSEVCAEFPSLPITYVFRDPAITALEHGVALFAEARRLPSDYVAVLHDDDWWGIDHLAEGLKAFEANGDAVAYWASSYFVHGENSWFIGCWNMSCWIVTDFGPLEQLAKLRLKEAALACVPSAPAAYSSLIAQKGAIEEAYREATKTGNPFDNDRLLFLELARRGLTLVNLVPQVFVRMHSTQDQRSFSGRRASEHMGAATRRILQLCEAEGIDVIAEFERLYDECPIPECRRHLIDIFDPRVLEQLRREGLFPLKLLPARARTRKWFIRQMVPPILWSAAKRLRKRPVPNSAS